VLRARQTPPHWLWPLGCGQGGVDVEGELEGVQYAGRAEAGGLPALAAGDHMVDHRRVGVTGGQVDLTLACSVYSVSVPVGRPS
jgi:hypothetical protein